MEGDFQVKVKFQAGSKCSVKTISLTIDPTLGELQQRISDEFNVAPHQQKVIYKGRILADDPSTKLIQKHQLKSGDLLVVIEIKSVQTPTNPPPINTTQQQPLQPINNPIPTIQQPAPVQAFKVDEGKVAQLQEMGYPKEEITLCLTAARNDVMVAVEFLESGIPDDLGAMQEDEDFEDEEGEEGEEGFSGVEGHGTAINQEQIQEFLQSEEFAQMRDQLRANPENIQGT